MIAAIQFGDQVEHLESGACFAVAAVDGDTIMRGEDGAWFHVDDVCLVSDSIAADLHMAGLDL